MPLINDVKSICARLAPRGWFDLLRKVTDQKLDITIAVSELDVELTKPLGRIHRDLDGFQEFATDGMRAVEPGAPAKSLLYHALVCGDVRPLRDGKPSTNPKDYPTLEEIDTIENFIYSRARRMLTSFRSPVVAVLAYQYRPLSLSTHRMHADLAFSRTGIARVGTDDQLYDPILRSYEAVPAGDRGFRVLPARYAAFIAEPRLPGPADSVLRPVPQVDDKEKFYFPAHKLFKGEECLYQDDGSPIILGKLEYFEFHINEKLRKLHTKAADNPGFVKPLSGFDLDSPPFTRDTKTSDNLIKLQTIGASLLVVSAPAPLVQSASQKINGVNQLVRFKVPKDNTENRFWTSLQLPFPNRAGRAAPEYANIRQEVVTKPNGQTTIVDLNLTPVSGTAPAQQFDRKVQNGGYEAAHFIDQTCDGAIAVRIKGLSLDGVCAYSLVTAVDFFPQVEQVEIQEWIERISGAPLGLDDPPIHFAQGGPKPLSDGRFTRTQARTSRTLRIPNATLPHPDPNTGAGARAFSKQDQTATALIGAAPADGAFMPLANSTYGTSCLPDAASDVFAPGWDVSEHLNLGPISSYVAYGLGSPFPEDSKLCAALNSFWPAAAPDSSRTYGLSPTGSPLPTSIPLLDSELGYHVNHPRAKAGEVKNGIGWDGDFGPFFVAVGDLTFVDCSDPNRADLTRRAFEGQMGFSGLELVTSKEMIRRMDDLRFCLGQINPGHSDPVTSSRLWLVTVEKVEEWKHWASAGLRRASTQLTGPGYIYVFADIDKDFQPFGDPPLRRRYRVNHRHEFQLTSTIAFLRTDSGAYTKMPRAQ